MFVNPLFCNQDVHCLLKLYKLTNDAMSKKDMLEKIVKLETGIPVYKQLYTRLYGVRVTRR